MMDDVIIIGLLFSQIAVLNILGQGGEGVTEEWDSLAELPLDKLLHVKKALEANIDLEDVDDNESGFEEDLAMAIRERKKKKKKYKDDHHRHEHGKRPFGPHQDPIRRDSWETETPWKSGKGKGDIQSIFHATITILAFLAFGGYLLCLLLHAIKGYPGTVYPTTTTPTTTTTATTAAAGRKRRRRRNTSYQSAPAPERSLVALDHMIQTMVTVAESYAKYERLNINNHA